MIPVFEVMSGVFGGQQRNKFSIALRWMKSTSVVEVFLFVCRAQMIGWSTITYFVCRAQMIGWSTITYFVCREQMIGFSTSTYLCVVRKWLVGVLVPICVSCANDWLEY